MTYDYVCVHIGDSITPFCPIGTKRCNGVSNPPVKYRVLFWPGPGPGGLARGPGSVIQDIHQKGNRT